MLKQLQQAFDSVIYHRDNEKLTALISDKPNIKATTGIKIYRNNTIGALLQALFAVYPITVYLLGKDYFKQLAIYHIRKKPSTNNNLDNYGENFSASISDLANKHAELSSMSYLQNLTDFEWLLNKCYYIKNTNIFDIEAFSRLTNKQQATCQFTLAKDVFLFTSQYDLLSMRQSYLKNNKIIIKKQQQHILIYKKELNTKVAAISINDYNLILATKKHTLTELMPFLQKTKLTLNDLISKRWITGFTHV